MLTATSEITSDQFVQCFPQAWEFLRETTLAYNELKLQQEKAKEEARIEARAGLGNLHRAISGVST